MKRLWNDECGAILSAELVLVMTIAGLGMVVGLKAIQSSVILELGDLAASFGSLDQSYSVAGTAGCEGGPVGILANTAGWNFTDGADLCSDANGVGGGIIVSDGFAGETVPTP